MIIINYDEDTHVCSVCDNKDVARQLTFRIHEGFSCSFWIEPIKNDYYFRICEWEFSIKEILFTTFPDNVKELGDSFNISAKENNEERIITIKKTEKFEDANEIMNSIQIAIDKITSKNIWGNNVIQLSDDGKISCIVTKKCIYDF